MVVTMEKTALQKWIDNSGWGATTRIHYECRLAINTIKRAARGESVRRETAQAISAATGGEVSVEDILLGRTAA